MSESVAVKNIVTGVVGTVGESTAAALGGDWVRVEAEPKRKQSKKE